jgi:hypothetical protein
LVAIVFLVGVFVVVPVTNGAVIMAVARLYLRKSITAIEAISEGFRRLLPLLGTTILFSLALMGGFILCVIPFFIFAIWFGLYQQVVMLENLSGVAALKRSKQLVREDWMTFLGLGLILTVIALLLHGGADLVRQPHLQMIVSALVFAVTVTLSTAALVVFYFSCRCNVENFDLHYLAEAIGAEPGAIENGQMSGGMR